VNVNNLCRLFKNGNDIKVSYCMANVGLRLAHVNLITTEWSGRLLSIVLSMLACIAAGQGRKSRGDRGDTSPQMSNGGTVIHHVLPKYGADSGLVSAGQ